jgi:hypothetical protein
MEAKKTKPLREVLCGAAAAVLGSIPKLGLPGDDTPMAPFISDAAEIISAAWKDHPEKGPHLFRRDTLPVIPIPGSKRFAPMKAEYFVSWAERHFAPFKTRYDNKGNPYDITRPMPKEIARSVLESLDFALELPPIKRTYPIPVPISSDAGGTITLCTPGYHADTGAFVFESDFELNPEYICKDDGLLSAQGYYDDRMSLHEAVTGLYNIHSRFPFSDWSEPFCPTEDSPFFDPEDHTKTHRTSRSLAVQIMSMLANFAGGIVSPHASRLGFIYNANKQRSGKTLLGKIAVSTVYGNCKLQSWREKDEDMIKILDSETLAATTYIFFDNIRNLIASGPLEGFMTTNIWTGRILGASTMFEAENNAILIFTGNNTHPGPDMQERTLICDLYVETADRQDRGGEEIPRDQRLDDVWLSKPANRRHLLSCLWTIVRHWDAAGRPLATGKARRGFEEWCEVIGGMVEFAGFGDALERPTNLENTGDTETDDIRALVELVSKDGSHIEKTIQEIVHICWENGFIPWCMHGREEYIEKLNCVTLKLNDASNSRFGTLLQRATSGERGEIHEFRNPDGTPRKVRFSCKGRGRQRRFVFRETTPPTPK